MAFILWQLMYNLSEILNPIKKSDKIESEERDEVKNEANIYRFNTYRNNLIQNYQELYQR